MQLDNITRGYVIKQKRRSLSKWENLINEWIFCTEKYVNILDASEGPYSYNERANVGILAGAAWKAGWIALEEYGQEKGQKYHTKWKGRVDLYLNDGHDCECIVEAKFKWLSSMVTSSYDELVAKHVGEATKDAMASVSTYEIDPVGLCFFPFFVSGKIDHIDQSIESAICGFKKTNCDLLAWSFPKMIRSHYETRSVGVILAGNLGAK